MNDSTIPAELTMVFPAGPIALLPDTEKFISVFLFPDEICPDTAQDVFNYGINHAETHLRTRSSGPTSLRTTVLPGDYQHIYIGVTFPPVGQGGLARAELFIHGQTPSASIFPVGSVPAGKERSTDLDLIFGAAIDPPQHYAMVPCGRVVFAH